MKSVIIVIVGVIVCINLLQAQTGKLRGRVTEKNYGRPISGVAIRLSEIGLQLSGLAEAENAVKVGTFLNTDMLIIGKLYFDNYNYEIFLKLVRVETAEILAVTKLRLDYRLGL